MSVVAGAVREFVRSPGHFSVEGTHTHTHTHITHTYTHTHTHIYYAHTHAHTYDRHIHPPHAHTQTHTHMSVVAGAVREFVRSPGHFSVEEKTLDSVEPKVGVRVRVKGEDE